MISNKTIIFAAAAFATTNAVAIKSQVQTQDFWGDVAGGFEDAWDWTKGAGESAYKWTKSAAYDVGDAFVNSYDWMEDGGNWEALGKTLTVSMKTGIVDGNFGQGWDIFTNSDLYYGDTWDDLENYKKMMEDHKKMCATTQPKVGEPIPGNEYGDNFTENFNLTLDETGTPKLAIYGAFGNIKDPNHKMMRSRDCERADCLNPCYGEIGECFKCAQGLINNEGERSNICDKCTV